jgi:hypothetical protein
VNETGSTEIVRFTILEEQGPGDILLFGCNPCGPDKKLTSHQLESHMRDIHDAPKFTVGTGQRPARNQGRKTAAGAPR